MAKFQGLLGYAIMTETAPGVHIPVITEHACRGDILRNNHRWENGVNLNDNLTINNQFSIVADAFVLANFQNIKYLKWMDTKWKVNLVEIKRPRLILNIGGVYNG